MQIVPAFTWGPSIGQHIGSLGEIVFAPVVAVVGFGVAVLVLTAPFQGLSFRTRKPGCWSPFLSVALGGFSITIVGLALHTDLIVGAAVARLWSANRVVIVTWNVTALVVVTLLDFFKKQTRIGIHIEHDCVPKEWP